MNSFIPFVLDGVLTVFFLPAVMSKETGNSTPSFCLQILLVAVIYPDRLLILLLIPPFE